MKKNLILLVLLGFGCSKSDSPTPAVPPCVSELTTAVALGTTYAYTGDTFTISGTKFCADDIVSVIINDQEIQPSDLQATKISFVVPSLIADSASVKIKSKTATVSVKGKFALFPGGGTWKEVASFPGSGRKGVQPMALGGAAYISGGSVYTGYTAPNYNYTFYGDIFKYDLSANLWTLVITDDKVKNKSTGAATAGGKLFLIPPTTSGVGTTYDVNTGAFGTTDNYSSNISDGVTPVSVGADMYLCAVERSVPGITRLLIRKYNPGNNKWDLVTTNGDTNESTQINFVFERGGKIFIGTSQLNIKDVQFYSFDLVTNQFTTLVKATIATTNNVTILSHLFTINNLAYFCETGSASLSPTAVSVKSPTSVLYVYNFKNNTFRTSAHTFPESFYSVASVTINNRGFAGMSASASGSAFAYSQKFYEFTPK